MIQKFFAAGISRDELAPFLTVSNADEEYEPTTKSSYTGTEVDNDAVADIIGQHDTAFNDNLFGDEEG